MKTGLKLTLKYFCVFIERVCRAHACLVHVHMQRMWAWVSVHIQRSEAAIQVPRSTTLSLSLELYWYPESPSDPLGLQVHLQPHSVILALRFQTQVLTLAQRGL